MKPSILFILHLPPPVHGAAIAGEMVKESKIINSAVDATYINLTTSVSLNDIGKNSFSKMLIFFKIVLKVFEQSLFKKTDLCYVTLNAKGLGFYKDFLIVLILKLFGKRILFHFHNKGVRKYSSRPFDNLLYRICFRNTKSIVLTPLLYNDLSEFVEKKDVFFCPYGISDLFENKELKFIKKGEPCEFLWLSNMMVEKGVLVLLKACRLLKEKGLDFKCQFVGAWSDFTEDMFIQTLNEYDLADTVFAHGKKYNEEKLEFFQKADVFVFPTYYNNETFGIVNLEAMQAELPIISTFEGGIPDVVEDGVTAILVPQKDEIELAGAMEKLANDFELRIKMGKAGRVRYEKLFTLSFFEQNLTTILKKAILE